MHHDFRKHHLFNILSAYDVLKGPLDTFVRKYFQFNKAIGSKDRRWIGDAVYHLIRWQALLDQFCKPPISWEARWEAITAVDPQWKVGQTPAIERKNLQNHTHVSFPYTLYQLIEEHYGTREALRICLTSNTAAPTTLRVNGLKTTRREMLSRFSGARPTQRSSNGIVLEKRVPLQECPEFQNGLFDVQDEGSQLVADLIDAQPGDWVLDFCAGAGGKSLSISAKMKNRGQLFLHDIRESALAEARKRMNRAGAQNVQFSTTLNERWLGRMDWVVVDAPCTGTGTIRRNPDLKWRFSVPFLEKQVQKQRAIFKEALRCLKPSGSIVYITCSLLPQENEEQVLFFEAAHGLIASTPPLHLLPEEGGGDGFFGTVFKKRALVS